MWRTEILEKLLNCQYLWQLIRDRAKMLVNDTETPALPAGLCSEAEIWLPDEAMELIRDYEDAVERERVYREKKETAESKLKAMLGTAESGRIGNQLVTYREFTIQNIKAPDRVDH